MLLLSQSLQELIYSMLYSEEVKRLDPLSGFEEPERFSLQRSGVGW